MKVLDIGCGNHSPSITRKYFPNLEYWGVDKELYNNDQIDLSNMHKFIKTDLESSNLDELPDNYFDVIIMSHVIEHVHNSKLLIMEIVKKVKYRGFLFIETPTEKSVDFPKKDGTLNFYDDPTHIKPVKLVEIKDLLAISKFRTLKYGVRRYKRRLLIFPALILYSLHRYKKIIGPILWDIYGFSWYLVAIKEKST